MKIGDKVFIINPEGAYNRPFWIETVVVKFDDNGEDFFTADAVMFTEKIMGEDLTHDGRGFALSAEGKTWWRENATRPSAEKASDLALAWYWD